MSTARPVRIATVKSKARAVFDQTASARRASQHRSHTFPADTLLETLTAKQLLTLADFVIDGRACGMEKAGYFYWCPLFIFPHAPATIRSLVNRGLVSLTHEGDRAALTERGRYVTHLLRRRVT